MIEAFDPSWWLLVASLLPLAVGVVTQKVSDSRVKALALAVLAAVTGIVTSLIDNSGALTQAALQTGIETFAVAVVSYYGFLKPTGLAGAVQEKTKDVGI